MSSEPNRKIEDLLKRYAEQRKAASSADFEFHPATRNLLQGEVARTFGKTGTEKKKSSLLLLWPRLAIAGAFTAMLVFTVMMLNKPQRELKVAQSPAEIVAPVPVQSRVVEVSKPDLDASADKAALPTLETAAVQTEPSANLFAKRDDALRSRTLSDETRSEVKLSEPIQPPVPAERKSEALADKKIPAKSEAAETFARATSVSGATVAAAPQSPAAESPKYFFADAEAQNRWQFVQQDSRAKYRQNLLSPTQPKILQSFDLVRTGGKVRVIESDGSIYDGEILAAAQDKSVEKDSAISRDQNAEFAFRATGTNQQLNRVVTFTGNFAFTELGALASAQIGTIQGKVSIGGTNQFEIRALETGK